MKRLDPKSIVLFGYTYFVGLIFLSITTYGLFWLIFRELPLAGWEKEFPVPNFVLLFIDWWGLLFLFLAIISLIWAYLSYYFYRYELREEGFRKEHGVVWKKYVTVPYGRIQNVDIYRGPLARILGLSDLSIQTAGSSESGSYGGTSEARLMGITKAEAEHLRDELVKRAGGKSKGL